MSLPRDAMLDLMAYADGELEGDDRARVEQMIATSSEAKRVVESMRSLGDEVRGAHEAHSSRFDAADAIAGAVMAKLEPASTAASAAEMGALVSLAERRNAMRARATMAVAAVAALAAGVLLYLRSNATGPGPVADETPHESAPVTQPSAPPATTGSELPSLAANVATEVDLEEVESSAHRVSVFYVPKPAGAGGGSASSVVIWIDDHAKGGK